jgi:hypothetical protein
VSQANWVKSARHVRDASTTTESHACEAGELKAAFGPKLPVESLQPLSRFRSGAGHRATRLGTAENAWDIAEPRTGESMELRRSAPRDSLRQFPNPDRDRANASASQGDRRHNQKIHRAKKAQCRSAFRSTRRGRMRCERPSRDGHPSPSPDHPISTHSSPNGPDWSSPLDDSRMLEVSPRLTLCLTRLLLTRA